MTTLSSSLRFKHRVATSPLAGVAGRVRNGLRRMRGIRHPVLGPLLREDAMMDAVMAQRIKPEWDRLDAGAHLGSAYYRMAELAPKGQHAMIEASADKAAMLELMRQPLPDTATIRFWRSTISRCAAAVTQPA
ncbi:hypothetical protein Z945_1115 [Sulfitobacter noctilucae]|uniref:hypothetical protein n=1 Tax=Sulfitobacter noctilucae TaxID=1342302 RepID=UPI00046ACA12|nr:hypothetical protein [Sulfitobacter noctilucae]KIN60148.1 hypothetical protein Z945_1115 [Sulfitobacter noctilucae]